MHNGAYGAAAHTNTHPKKSLTQKLYLLQHRHSEWLSNSRVSHMKDHSWHGGAFCYPGRQKNTLKKDSSIKKTQ